MFKENIYNLRKAKKLTSKEVASALGIGEDAYEKLELGFAEPDYLVIKKLANYYSVDSVLLFNGNVMLENSKAFVSLEVPASKKATNAKTLGDELTHVVAEVPASKKVVPYFSRGMTIALVILAIAVLLTIVVLGFVFIFYSLLVLCLVPLLCVADCLIMLCTNAKNTPYRIVSRIIPTLLVALLILVSFFVSVDNICLYYFVGGAFLALFAVAYLMTSITNTIICSVKEAKTKEKKRTDGERSFTTVVPSKDGNTKKVCYMPWVTITNLAIGIALLIMFFAIPLAGGNIDFGFGSATVTVYLYHFFSSASALFVMTAVIMFVTIIYVLIESLMLFAAKEIKNTSYRIVGRVLNAVFAVLSLILFVACLGGVNAQIIIIIILLVAFVIINAINLILCSHRENQ